MLSPTVPDMEVSGKTRFALRALQAIAFAGLLLYAAHTTLGLGGQGLDRFAEEWLYNGLILASACLCLARAVLVSKERSVWMLFGIGLLAWSGGEIYYTVSLADLENPPYPSLSDALYLAFYPASYVGLVLLIKSRMRNFHLSLWVDGVVAALAVAALGATILVQPILEITGGTTATVMTDLAYPLGDVLLLALVVAAFAMTGWRPGRAWAFIGAGLMMTAVADGIFLFETAKGNPVQGSFLETLWPASTLILASAACQAPQRLAPVRLEGWRVLVVPSVFALTALGLLMYSRVTPVDGSAAMLAAATLVAVIVRMAMTFGENLRVVAQSRHEALTDALTGLGNRRRLLDELEQQLKMATAESPKLLVLFDLDGFKRYNDTYGHQAGDALLARLGSNLEQAVKSDGTVYRLGGDEFCALVSPTKSSAEAIIAAAVEALSDRSQGFDVSASHGVVLLPKEAADAARALQLADQRMYAGKNGRQSFSASRQAADALLQALHERRPDLADHVHDVARMATAVGGRLGLLPDELEELGRAAELHDVGKVAVPDEILEKPGAFDELEWNLVRQHTVVGERILGVAPALGRVAKIVRSTHERYDGSGYPDNLAGADIPLGARIISVCDAFHAMTSDRQYRATISFHEAIDELRECAGTQFDPMIVDAFCEEIAPAYHPSTPSEDSLDRHTFLPPVALPTALSH
jgi:two-component system cell cycle response regulator